MFMRTDCKPFSSMGLSNKDIPEGQDLHAMLKREVELRNEEESERSVSVLKIKLPSTRVVVVDHGCGRESDDGCRCRCRTPKAVDQEKKCPPPPPRKPKSKKRKILGHDDERVLLDLSTEIESLFPPNILRDFVGGKIKKVRKGTSSAFNSNSIN